MPVVNLLLLILKIIGIILLSIIGLVLFIVLLILFVPIRYELVADYTDKKVDLRLKVSYLLHIFRVTANSNLKKTDFSIKILWFELGRGKRKKADDTSSDKTQELVFQAAQDEENLKSSETEVETETVEAEKNASETKITEVVDDSSQQEIPDDEAKPEHKLDTEEDATEAAKEINDQKEEAEDVDSDEEDIEEALKSDISSEKKKTSRKRKKKAKEKKNRREKSGDGVLDKIKNFAKLLKENKKAIDFLLKQLKAVFRHVLPGKHSIKLKLGLEDPAFLGELVGAVSIIRGLTNIKIEFTPYFNEKIFELESHFKGRLRLAALLWIGLKVYFNKDVRKIIKAVR